MISSYTASIPRAALRQMICLVKSLFHLSRQPLYRERIRPFLPETALFDPGHDSVMMGYDFHLSEDGPKLIEVNTNAGGILYVSQVLSSAEAELKTGLPPRREALLFQSFNDEMLSFSKGVVEQPRCIAIVDEDPREQFLFPEMEAFCRQFEKRGISSVVADPTQLSAGEKGVFWEGTPVDLIYNRHCDFYLQTPQMAGIGAAYLAKTVCLTPNPFAYGLLADKRRLILWSDPNVLGELGIAPYYAKLITRTVPESHMLEDLDREQVWASRKQWVFKPATRFGSKGVLVGKKISRSRFDALSPSDTLIQRLSPPSLTYQQSGEAPFKTDFRLYTYRARIIGLVARLYQGQVTNMRTPGGGFARVEIV